MTLNPQPAPQSWGDKLVSSTYKMALFGLFIGAIAILVFQICMDVQVIIAAGHL